MTTDVYHTQCCYIGAALHFLLPSLQAVHDLFVERDNILETEMRRHCNLQILIV